MIELRKAMQMHEGDGVTVKRLMPVPAFRNFDPFVLWDDFTVTPGHGFPDHPHRGFEAITYLFSGSIRHEDNLGNASTVAAGGAQRFTAGRGIVHSEMPNEATPTRGIQLWINLPGRLKQTPPDYQQVDDPGFPVTEIEGGRLKTLVGPGSPLQIMTPMRYYELELQHGARHETAVEASMRGLLYVVAGAATLNGTALKEADCGLFDQETRLAIDAAADCRLMLCYGTPHGEPIIQYGPFVD